MATGFLPPGAEGTSSLCPEAVCPSPERVPPKIWSENNRKISTTIDLPPPENFLEESQSLVTKVNQPGTCSDIRKSS